MTNQNDPKNNGLTADEIMESELNFHSLFTAMTEGVAIHQMIYDVNGKAIDYIIRDVNPSFEKNLGIPADKARGALASKLYDLTPPPYVDIYEHVVQTGEPYYFTTYFQPLDRYFEISVFIPKKDWFATVFLDVTGSRRAVEALRATGRKYRRLYESMMDGFARMDMEGNIREFNSCFRDMLGYADEDLLKLSFKDFTPEYWHEYEKRIILNQVIPNGFSGVYEKEYMKKDGTVFPVELRISLIRDEKEIPDGMWGVVRDITDRKKAEHELEQMIDRFSLATRSANMGVWERDLITGQLLWDDKMLELYGLEREEFQNNYDSWINLIHPEDVAQVNEALQMAIRGEKDYDCEFRILHKDNRIHTIKAYAQVVRNSAGTPLRFTGINYDITEQKKTQESLILSEMFNRGLVESAPVGILFLDHNGLITYENPTMQKMMKISESQDLPVVGKYFKELSSIKAVLPESKIDKILKGETVNAQEIHYLSVYGKEVDLEVYTAPLLDQEEKVNGIIIMAVDITKPVIAGKELRESERKYRKLYESMRDGFTFMDMNKHILEYNSFFLTLTGYLPEDIEGMESIRSIIPEKWNPVVDEIVSTQLMVKGYTDVFEIEYRRKNDIIFPVEIRLFLNKNTDGTPLGIWSIVRDITDRKMMENEIKEMNSVLEQKVEEKTIELQERVKDLERFYKATIDRELRMKEMRTRIEELEKSNT
jgi:PAS domain S-box-containing protein